MSAFLQFLSEPFNWALLATVLLTFLVEHLKPQRRTETVIIRPKPLQSSLDMGGE